MLKSKKTKHTKHTTDHSHNFKTFFFFFLFLFYLNPPAHTYHMIDFFKRGGGKRTTAHRASELELSLDLDKIDGFSDRLISRSLGLRTKSKKFDERCD